MTGIRDGAHPVVDHGFEDWDDAGVGLENAPTQHGAEPVSPEIPYNIDETLHSEQTYKPSLSTQKDIAELYAKLTDGKTKFSQSQLQDIRQKLNHEIDSRGFFHNTRMKWQPEYRARQDALDALNNYFNPLHKYDGKAQPTKTSILQESGKAQKKVSFADKALVREFEASDDIESGTGLAAEIQRVALKDSGYRKEGAYTPLRKDRLKSDKDGIISLAMNRSKEFNRLAAQLAAQKIEKMSVEELEEFRQKELNAIQNKTERPRLVTSQEVNAEIIKRRSSANSQ